MNKFTLPKALLLAAILFVSTIYFYSLYSQPGFNTFESYSILAYLFALFSFNTYFAIHFWTYRDIEDPKYYIVSLGLMIGFVFTFLFSLLLLPAKFVELYLHSVSESWGVYFISALIAGYSIHCVSKIVRHAVR